MKQARTHTTKSPRFKGGHPPRQPLPTLPQRTANTDSVAGEEDPGAAMEELREKQPGRDH